MKIRGEGAVDSDWPRSCETWLFALALTMDAIGMVAGIAQLHRTPRVPLWPKTELKEGNLSMMRRMWKRLSRGAVCATALLGITDLAYPQTSAPLILPAKQVVVDAPPTGPNQPSVKQAPVLAAPRAEAVSVDELRSRLDRQEKLIQQLLEKLQKVEQQQTSVQQPPPQAEIAPKTGATPEYIEPGTIVEKGDGGILGNYVIPNSPRFDFKNGIFIQSPDKQFSFRFNDLTQIDYRNFSRVAGIHQGTSLNDNFNLARQWLIFSGSVTDLVDYTAILAGGPAPSPAVPAPFNVLDTYLDFNPFGRDYKEYLQIRVGRMKTPFLYQFYKFGPQDYIAPELSMYSTNFAQNRQVGAMAHGELFSKRIDYAAGVFNGAPNTFEVTQSNREAIAYLGLNPFRCEDNFLKNLIVAGSYAVGVQNGPAIPGNFGTAVPSVGPPNNDLISPTFLTFGPNAIMAGYHDAWALDLVYNYKAFNFYGEYNGGHQTYALSTKSTKDVPVIVRGWSATATYFLTGEEITPSRKAIQPFNPYSWSEHGFGAWEVFGRYSRAAMTDNVLTTPGLTLAGSASAVQATDIGLNWYLNQYIRITFDWQHSMFNHPISLSPGVAGAKTSALEDLYWLRFQLYY